MADPYTLLVQSILAANFSSTDQELLIGNVKVSDLTEEFGTPIYIYDAAIIRRKLRELFEALEGFECLYSVKANPNPSIIQLMLEAGCGMEIASEGELELVLACGCEPQNIFFAGPGKTDRELELSVRRGIGAVHVESFQEIERLGRIAKKHNAPISVALRVNPLFLTAGATQQMGGRATAFGIDEEDLMPAIVAIQKQPQLRLTGLHVYTGTQNLNAPAFETLYSNIIEIAKRIVAKTGEPLHTIDFGGGFGVPYFSGDTALDLVALREATRRAVSPLREDPMFKHTKLVVESGRFLTAESGIYATRVIATKHSRGTRFAVLDGGLHHHLPASGQFGQIVKRNFPIAAANRLGAVPTMKQELVGPLCTPLDVLGRSISLPELIVGDIVVILQSGAYARTTSPLGFLSHYEPAELLVDEGRVTIVRHGGDLRDLTKNTMIDSHD